ncbi:MULTISPECIES: hypothetical protein [Bacillus cereus group]|uniref:hypothetical protein n=1 Tax=Bacillus cereus group TaxID=86661 RepID=UPI001CBCDE66|nr:MULTISPECIES: hypothetical protein [Bacillus cereus group]
MRNLYFCVICNEPGDVIVDNQKESWCLCQNHLQEFGKEKLELEGDGYISDFAALIHENTSCDISGATENLWRYTTNGLTGRIHIILTYEKLLNLINGKLMPKEYIKLIEKFGLIKELDIHSNSLIQ